MGGEKWLEAEIWGTRLSRTLGMSGSGMGVVVGGSWGVPVCRQKIREGSKIMQEAGGVCIVGVQCGWRI